MENFSEEQYISMLQEVSKEFNNLSESERAEFAALMGIDEKELVKAFEEIETALQETMSEISEKKDSQISLNQLPADIPQASVDKFSSSDEQLYLRLIENLRATIKIIQDLLLKIQTNEHIHNICFKNNTNILLRLSMLLYYFKIIKSHIEKLLSVKTISIPVNDINELLDIANIFSRQFSDLLSTVIELNDNNGSFDLLAKYSVRNKNDAINVITTQKNNYYKEKQQISSDKNLDEKSRKKLLVKINYNIKDLDDDLKIINSESFENDLVKKRKNIISQKEYYNKSINSFFTNLTVIFDTNNDQKLELFIKKYFPHDFDAGEKQKSLERARLLEEQNIEKQKGSQARFNTEEIKPSRQDTKSLSRQINSNNSFSQEMGDYSQSELDDSLIDNKDKDNKSENENDQKNNSFLPHNKNNNSIAPNNSSFSPSYPSEKIDNNKNKKSDSSNSEENTNITGTILLTLISEIVGIYEELIEIGDMREERKKEKNYSESEDDDITNQIKKFDDLLDIKLQRLEDYIIKIPLKALAENLTIKDNLEEDNDSEEDNESRKPKGTIDLSLHRIKTYGEKIYLSLHELDLFSDIFTLYVNRITKEKLIPTWYNEMLKEIALQEARSAKIEKNNESNDKINKKNDKTDKKK